MWQQDVSDMQISNALLRWKEAEYEEVRMSGRPAAAETNGE